MIGAVDYAYESLDMAVVGGDLYQRFFEDFLTLFTGNNDNEKLLWFTLNQDLLVERESYRDHDSKKIRSAGVDYDLCSGFLTLPQAADFQKTFNKVEKSINDSKISYIKLHGSCKWVFSFAQNQQAMAVGIKKLDLIEKEPLLRIYSAKLRSTIEEGEKKLMIIGYGFKDEDINRILIEGVEKHGLRLYILNPNNITAFESYLKYSSPLFYRKCWDGLFAYFTGTLEDVFRKGHSGEMSLLKEIEIRLTQ